MNTDRDFERVAAEWLEAGSDSTPPNVIDAVLLAVRTTPQERDFRIPWRTLSMRSPVYSAVFVIAVAVAGVAALYAFGPRVNVGPAQTSSPSTQPTQQPTQIPAPSASATPLSGFLPEGWTTFEAGRYGLSIGYPADWIAVPPSHDWTFATDAGDRVSNGQVFFRSPSGSIHVGAWAVPLDPGTEIAFSGNKAWADVAAWVEQYCQQTGDSPCTGIRDRAVELCNERWDCHPGLLVPFEDSVQAFFTGGGINGMAVVAVWSGESDADVAVYGGARHLLETFLMTMEVCPADQDRSPWGYCPQAVTP
jgi:hypothetical protein